MKPVINQLILSILIFIVMYKIIPLTIKKSFYDIQKRIGFMDKPDKIKAIIGLGNPGPAYYRTRHSIGFQVIDSFANRHGGSWNKKEFFEYAEVECNNQSLLLIKPQTFMNASGKIVPFLVKKGIKPEECLVIHDELELPFGKVTQRLGGSARGHNGLRSLIASMGADFWRLRCGIGRPEDQTSVSDFVLQPFSQSREEVLQMINKAVDTLEALCCPLSLASDSSSIAQ